MQDLAPPELDASVEHTQQQAQELVLRTVATHAESLLRTAYRHSLCADDAHDAYQRSMEIFMRRARTLDPEYVARWLHVVVKREAMEVRRGRSESVAAEDIDFDHHEAQTVASPEERVISAERATRAAEALQRLKPQELRAMWLKALGHSYAEIGQATGFSATKVNRCLAEGRKSFLERFEGIEAGEECRRWQTVLSAMVDGEATASQLTEVRPHLRNCPACRATLRRLHGHGRSLGAVLPVGIAGAGVKLAGLLERLLPGVSTSDGGAVTAGGAGVFGVGGAKLAGLLAAGAAATAGGGLVAVHEGGAHAAQHRAARPAGAVAGRAAAGREPAGAGAGAPVGAGAARPAVTTAAVAAHHAAAARPGARAPSHRHAPHRLVVRGLTGGGRVEFAPAGGEPARARPAASAAAAPHPATPHATTPPSSRPSTPSAGAGGADAVRGEFAPHP